MKRFFLGLLALVFITGLLGGFSILQTTVYAENSEEDEEYHRVKDIVVEYLAHEWWLVRWKDNEITCRFLVEHAGWPTQDEVETWCGKTKAREWLNAKPCVLEEGESYSQCSGAYLSYFESLPGERSIEVELPLPQVWLSISNCEQSSPENTCTSLPNLRLIGEELLANESIIRIQGTIDGVPFSCPAEECELPLWPTGSKGVEIEFWADSSFGDSSEVFDALVRVQPWGDFTNPEGPATDQHLWYVDVISTQWRGSTPASCSAIWGAFPDIGGPPPWLLTPDQAGDLYSEVSFYYLAGMLISSGQADASQCQDGGLTRDGVANECGVQAAYQQVVDWQNMFNEEIMTAANETGVPAQLLKNVFSRESQLWPGIYTSYKEAGFGQLTENGADTVLLWNPSFFHQFCPLVLSKERCDLGFGNISEGEQAMLRGALVTKVNSTCPDCPEGIDLSQANFSVRIFAEGMIANCEQVGKIIRNTTSRDPGQVSNFEDLWRFTLVNYNAGPGCLSNAIKAAYRLHGNLTWENVSEQLEEGCEGAIDYVEDISITGSGLEPTPTSWVQFSTPNAAQLTAMATRTIEQPTQSIPTATPSPTVTAESLQPTPTEGGYPSSYPENPTPVDNGYPAQPTPGPTGSIYP